MNLKNIGKNVKRARKLRYMTQERLAESVDISTIHMSHIETGNVSMSLECLLNVCNTLKVTPNDILMGEYGIFPEGSARISPEKMNRLSPDEFLFLNRIAELLGDLKINR